MSQIWDAKEAKAAIPTLGLRFRSFPDDVRHEFGKAIFDRQKGDALAMPVSRSMPSMVRNLTGFLLQPVTAGAFWYFTRSWERNG
jgi:hypothetical protein